MGVKEWGKKVVEGYMEDNAKFLFHSATFGWASCSMAYIFSLSTNKKLDANRKKFLIPQEIADGTLNIGLFWLLTSNLIKGTEKFFKKNVLADGKPVSDTTIKGAKVVASLVGAVISSNIITPILRNKIGAYTRTKMEEGQLKQVPTDIYDSKDKVMKATDAPKPPLNPRITMNTFMTNAKSYSGSLKI